MEHRENAQPFQYLYGSPPHPLEPHIQEQTSQSMNDNHFDDSDYALLQETPMVHQETEFGQILSPYGYHKQPGYMAGPSHMATAHSFPSEPLHDNGSINGLQAPTATLPPFFRFAPNANFCPPSAPLQVVQSPNIVQAPAWQHTSYAYPATIPPPTPNVAYPSLGNYGSANGIHQNPVQVSPPRAQKRRRRSPQRETASSTNSRLQTDVPQVDDSEHRPKRTRTDKSQATPACDLKDLDPTMPDIPERFHPFTKKIKEILSNPNKPPRSGERKPTINRREDFDDFQLIRDCKSQEPAVAGGLKYLTRKDASEGRKKSKALFHKKDGKCTNPFNDETFPITDEECCFYVLLIYNAMINWEWYQEWMRCLPDELCIKEEGLLLEECKRRMTRRLEILKDKKLSNKGPKSGSASIRSDQADDEEEANRPIIQLADLMPTPEQAKQMPPVVAQQKRILGRPLTQQMASEVSWVLLDCAVEAQQGRSGARPWTTTTEGSWESYPSFLERILALVNVLKTSKQTIRNILSLGDGWSQRLANNPYHEQAFKVENYKSNMEKKFSKLKTQGTATKKAKRPQLAGASAEPPCLDTRGTASGSQRLGEAEESGLSSLDAEGSYANPESLENGSEANHTLPTATCGTDQDPVGDHTQFEGYPDGTVEAAVWENSRGEN